MEDVEVVQCLQSQHCLDEDAPDLALLEQFLPLLVLHDLLIQIPIVGELHDDAAYAHPYHRFLPSRKTSL